MSVTRKAASAAQSGATTRIGSRKAVQSAVTREAILAACLDLFSKRGVVSTSIDMVASAAGITKGAVYWHFESKDALFEAILELIRTRWVEAVLQPVSNEGPATMRLQQLFAGYSQLFTASPEMCFFFQRVLLEADHKYSPRVAQVFKQTARFIARVLDDGKATGEFRADFDSLQMAHLILASIEGATQQQLVNSAMTLDVLLAEARTMTLSRVAPVST